MMISEIQLKLKKGEMTCVDVVIQYLNNIKLHNEKLNVFITVTDNEALAYAKELDKLIDDNANNLDELFKKMPLLGVPVAYKDIYSTKNIRTTAASNMLKDYIAPYDATVVQKIKLAGGIMLGKLNCDAFAHGASGHNSDFGDTLNPYDVTCIPGGSSSGSGVSVATEMAVVGFGSDTGGSIRNPASWCNVVGIKPTYGRVSRYGIIAMASSLDSIGHLTKTVEDNARVLQVSAGADLSDATSSERLVPDYLEKIKDGVKGLKIGVPKEYFTDEVSKEIQDTTRNALAMYEKLGAQIIEVSLPNTKYALAAYYIITPSEVSSNLGRFDGIRFGEKRESFGDEAKRRIMIGTYVLSEGYYDAYYLKAQKVRSLITQDFVNVFNEVDVLVAPVAPMSPPKIGENLDDPMKMYLIDILSVTANLAGIPALAVPAGFDQDGLPIGIQIMGKHFDEATLYRVGYALEEQLKLYERKPTL